MARFRRFLTGHGPEAKAILKALQLDHLAIRDLTISLAGDQLLQATATIALHQQQAEGLVEVLQCKRYALTELIDPDAAPDANPHPVV